MSTAAPIRKIRKLNLLAIRQRWVVSYINSSEKLILVEHPNRKLTVYGKNYSKKAAFSLIIRWLRIKAEKHLRTIATNLNKRVKAKYKKIVIRANRSLWGSYTCKKTISIDYKLIFLPPRLANNVILHELCHTKYWAHSKKFWQELAKYDKNSKKNNAELNYAEKYIPF